MARKKRRLSDEGAAVLQVFVRDPDAEIFGRQIIKDSGIRSGSLYPILRRHEERGFLASYWEPADAAAAAGRRPRRLYRLDPQGADRAIEALQEWNGADIDRSWPRRLGDVSPA